MGKIKKIILITIGSLLSLIVLLTLFTIVTPYPTTWAIRALFSSSTYTDHVDLETTSKNITILEDIKYPSKYKNNKLDIIYPTNYEESLQ